MPRALLRGRRSRHAARAPPHSRRATHDAPPPPTSGAATKGASSRARAHRTSGSSSAASRACSSSRMSRLLKSGAAIFCGGSRASGGGGAARAKRSSGSGVLLAWRGGPPARHFAGRAGDPPRTVFRLRGHQGEAAPRFPWAVRVTLRGGAGGAGAMACAAGNEGQEFDLAVLDGVDAGWLCSLSDADASVRARARGALSRGARASASCLRGGRGCPARVCG
jgi:hypothetical protein